jgi:hypothetical protein
LNRARLFWVGSGTALIGSLTAFIGYGPDPSHSDPTGFFMAGSHPPDFWLGTCIMLVGLAIVAYSLFGIRHCEV